MPSHIGNKPPLRIRIPDRSLREEDVVQKAQLPALFGKRSKRRVLVADGRDGPHRGSRNEATEVGLHTGFSTPVDNRTSRYFCDGYDTVCTDLSRRDTKFPAKERARAYGRATRTRMPKKQKSCVASLTSMGMRHKIPASPFQGVMYEADLST
jgi:hypothetical protein